MNFRIYFLKLAARHPAWRFFISLIHSSIFFCFSFILYVLNILRVEIVVGLVFSVPPIIILTYTFFLRRFANPTKLEELLKLKERKDKEREIERAIEKERKDKERESKERESKEREIERAIEKERKDKEKKEEEKEEEKRIKDNYLDIGLGHILPKTIEKIRNPITDKRFIKIDTTYTGGEFSKADFCQIYTVKYMPTLLHEIRKELIDELIENEMKYDEWKKFIKKKYDPLLIEGGMKEFLYKNGQFLYRMDLNSWKSTNNEWGLLVEIIFEKLIEYFLENGWTLSSNQFEQEVFLPVTLGTQSKTLVYKQVFYLHPPEK